MVKKKLINVGAKEPVEAYYCECGCGYWNFDKGVIVEYEKLHLEAKRIEEAARKEASKVRAKAAHLLGLDVIVGVKDGRPIIERPNGTTYEGGAEEFAFRLSAKDKQELKQHLKKALPHYLPK